MSITCWVLGEGELDKAVCYIEKFCPMSGIKVFVSKRGNFPTQRSYILKGVPNIFGGGGDRF